jgi:hypothetical protein
MGTYCPKASPIPIPCPDGTYGSGNIKNYDIPSACKECGRGLFSTLADPGNCLDCTAGHVCLGGTSSKYPTDRKKQKGYMCPLGHYCPEGSYKETACPIGYYSKYEGTEHIDDCLPCKLGWYSDVPGQSGCKKCGPTSTTYEGGSTTCTCTGENRTFIKSIGACLCKSGYIPKNDAANVDSSEDCELEVKAQCAADQAVDGRGFCIEEEDVAQLCYDQCPSRVGTSVAPGVCECSQIVDTDEVCDENCQKTIPTTTLGSDGLLTTYDPVTGRYETVDPSNIEGWYGDFKC